MQQSAGAKATTHGSSICSGSTTWSWTTSDRFVTSTASTCFFEELLHLLGGERDYDLEEKIATSLKRLAYLEEILAFSDPEG